MPVATRDDQDDDDNDSRVNYPEISDPMDEFMVTRDFRLLATSNAPQQSQQRHSPGGSADWQQSPVGAIGSVSHSLHELSM